MEENNKPSEPIIITPLPDRVNIYAALGLAILNTLLTAIVFFVGMVSSSLVQPYSNTSSLIGVAGVVLVLVVFFGVPALFGSRFGWRTIVGTFLLQAVLIFATVILLSIILTPPRTVDYPGIQGGPSLRE